MLCYRFLILWSKPLLKKTVNFGHLHVRYATIEYMFTYTFCVIWVEQKRNQYVEVFIFLYKLRKNSLFLKITVCSVNKL